MKPPFGSALGFFHECRKLDNGQTRAEHRIPLCRLSNTELPDG